MKKCGNQRGMSIGVLWMCLSVVVIVPFANDVCVAGFPLMQTFFHTAHINWVISFYLVGLAIGQLFYGPLSDNYGRKPVLLGGLLLFTVSSVITLFAHSFTGFLITRFMQALGACSAIISAYAIIRDRHDKAHLARPMGLLMAIIGICPSIAPLVGSILTVHYGWRSNFYFLVILGLLYCIVITVCLKETILLPKQKALKYQTIKNNYLLLLKNSAYVLPCLLSALAYGILFTYISLSPAYIITLYHYSIMDLGWIILSMGLIIFITSLIVPMVTACKGDRFSLALGCLLLSLGSLSMILTIYFSTISILAFIAPLAIVICGIGFIRATASVCAMQQADKSQAGSAASCFNTCTFVGGSICSSLSGWLVGSPLYFAVFALILSLTACGVLKMAYGLNKRCSV